MRKFDNAHVDVLTQQDQFGSREVGLTHPDVPGFMRIRDNGDIEIIAGEGLAILMNPRSKSITFVADHIKFITRREGGLRWNRVAFNDNAVTFVEPTFISIDDTKEPGNVYKDINFYTMPVDKDTHEVPDAVDKAAKEMKGDG